MPELRLVSPIASQVWELCSWTAKNTTTEGLGPSVQIYYGSYCPVFHLRLSSVKVAGEPGKRTEKERKNRKNSVFHPIQALCGTGA